LSSSEVERHVNWFALEKACGRAGCPVCSIVEERTTRYIDNMLFEHVSDRGFRAQYRLAQGFCTRHGKNLESFRDGLAVAILGEDILQSLMAEIQSRKFKKTKALCPACSAEQTVEREFLGYIAERTEHEFIEFFSRSSLLCVPHYRALCVTTKKIPRWLIESHEARYASLLQRVRSFIECSAWGRQTDFDALSDEDKIVWKELARTLRGSR